TTAFMAPRSVGGSLVASGEGIRSGSRVRWRSMRHRVALVCLAGMVTALAVLSPVTAATPTFSVSADYAAQAWSILPPGENGSLAFDAHTSDQARMYDALTLPRGKVTQRDIQRDFKPEPLGLGKEKPVSIERPRPGVRIARDRFDA